MQKNTLLKYLQPYKNEKELLISNQTTNDIIKGILETHYHYFSEYDKIYKYFDKDCIEDIAESIFNFLKKNVTYKIENENFQKLKSPSAIISTSGDCKSYSLFIAGVIAAFCRNENEKIPFAFRFAGYNNEDIEHVFIVLYPNTENEIWIDPVLNFFDERKVPYFYIDKKIKPMALYKISGVEQSGTVEQDNLLGIVGDVIDVIDVIGDWFDNSSRKWKSRTKKMKDLSPDEIINYYTSQLAQSGDLYWIAEYKRVWGDAAGWGSGYWDYLTQKGTQAAENVSVEAKNDYNDVVKELLSKSPDFLKGRQNLAYYNNTYPLEAIFNTGGNSSNGESAGSNFLAKAAGAALLYFMFK